MRDSDQSTKIEPSILEIKNEVNVSLKRMSRKNGAELKNEVQTRS